MSISNDEQKMNTTENQRNYTKPQGPLTLLQHHRGQDPASQMKSFILSSYR